MKIAAILLVAIAAVIFLKMPSDSADSQNSAESPKTADSQNADDPCFLSQPTCRKNLPNGWLELTIPNPIPAGKGFDILLKTQGLKVESATAHFEGLSMAMSAPEVVFSKNSDNADNLESWRTHAFLPICLTGTMRWRLTLLLNQSTSFSWIVESGQ